MDEQVVAIMLITIAICTLNRAESLRRTLDSLAAMRVPEEIDWEVVVVNNGCADHTDAVIAAFADRLPIRREFEPQRGLSRARNRAVGAAKGEYIVWTDDDVIVDPGWLAAYADAFRRWPEAAVFGGPIVPRYEEPVPGWIKECEPLIGGAFSLRDFGDQPLPLSIADRRLPFGANYAVRSREQQTYSYDPDLGVRPGRRLLGEETDVIERVLRSGATGYWVPAARVDHCIRSDRQTARFVVRHCAGLAESSQPWREQDETALWFGVPRWLWRRLIQECLSYRAHRWISPAPIWIGHLQRYAIALGTVRYWRRRRLRGLSPRFRPGR